jgi:hypothetical protein
MPLSLLNFTKSGTSFVGLTAEIWNSEFLHLGFADKIASVFSAAPNVYLNSSDCVVL